jgi:hypothetical protein
MTLDEVKAKLIGRTIAKVEADEWNENIEGHFLDTAYGEVRITLDDGTVLASWGEPVVVEFP